jgi:hypothetical protein
MNAVIISTLSLNSAAEYPVDERCWTKAWWIELGRFERLREWSVWGRRGEEGTYIPTRRETIQDRC